jgi:hypothetical protein
MKAEDYPLCPKHQTPLKQERLKLHTIVWCADCDQGGGQIWMGRVTNEVTHEEQS